MKIIVATRDLDYGAGSVAKEELKRFDLNKNIKKIIVIGPKKLKGYSKKIHFELIPNKGKYFITKHPYFAFMCNNKITKILKKEKFDKIFLHHSIFAKYYGIPMEVKIHVLHKSILFKHPKNLKLFIADIFHFLYSYFDDRTIRFADKVSFVDKTTTQEAKKNYPQYTQKFYFEPNRIDKSKFFKLGESDRKKLKRELQIDDKKKNILYVGRLEPMKGILDLLRVIERLKIQNIRLIVVGDGPDKDKLKKYSFVDYRGKKPNEELYKYYNVADLFIMPSYYETGPLTILEAQACNCKILSRNVGIAKEVLKPEEIFTNKEELKQKLTQILENE